MTLALGLPLERAHAPADSLFFAQRIVFYRVVARCLEVHDGGLKEFCAPRGCLGLPPSSRIYISLFLWISFDRQAGT